MDRLSKKVYDVTGQYKVVIGVALLAMFVGTIFLSGLFLRDDFRPTELVILVMVAVALQTFVLFSIYRVFSESKRGIRIAYELHDINHEYRDRLSELYSVYESIQQTGEKISEEELLYVERLVLSRVCRKIADIFSTLTVRKCLVTVKLYFDDPDGEKYCFTWARSESNNQRSEDPDQMFSVGTGENTGFDEALKNRPGEISHFHSADLEEMARSGRYKNERQGWRKLYSSTIVVPIRHIIHLEDQTTTDILGFLCVDTTHKNRLNDNYHVALLAAFADQMYNFLSLMRHSYIVEVENDEVETQAEAVDE